MNWSQIILTALVFVFGFLATYFKAEGSILTKVSEFIAEAEEEYANTEKAGNFKKQWVVNELSKNIPLFLRGIFTDEVLDILVENVFHSIQTYAKLQLSKHLNI